MDTRSTVQHISLLKRLSKEINWSDDQIHRDIYELIRKHAVPNFPADQCPPFPVLAYAIRNITNPTLIHEQIPDLLILIAHLNVLRKDAVSKATTVLKWNDHYRRRPQRDVALLLEGDHMLLEGFVRRSGDEQKRYRDIVNTLYHLDIYHSHLHADSNEAWIQRMKTYFPGQFPLFGQSAAEVEETTRNYLFHYDLTDEERIVSRATGLTCAKFIRDAASFQEHSVQSGIPSTSSVYEVLPPPDEHLICKSIEGFLQELDALLFVLKRLFGNR